MSINVIVLEKDTLNDSLPSEFYFLCSAGFEERGRIIPLSIDKRRIKATFIFKNGNEYNKDSQKILSEHFSIDTRKMKLLDLNNPISISKTLIEVISAISKNKESNIVVDITTFTNETFLILFKLLYNNKNTLSSIKFLYSHALDYSNGTTHGEQKIWLSKGCRDIRNIVGYPGVMKHSAKTCLVLLSGYEFERATRLIELLEPDKLVIGYGVNPVDKNHRNAMVYFKNEFSQWVASYNKANQREFEFSCVDIEATIFSVSKLLEDNSGDNFIIVPMNTKLSTMAVAIVALKNDKVQICYAIPEAYNTENYSKPSGSISLIDGVFE